jgi:ubiquinone/menaquinone biosynthesis C-methylase UbiE
MKKQTIDKILSETKHGYDMVSKKFSQTRKHFWRGLEFISDYVKDGDDILDYGCGNGRLKDIFLGKKIKYLGVDISQQLIEDAIVNYGSENAQFKKISPSQNKLSFLDNAFDTVYSIAVFHHMPGSVYRKNIARDLYRIIKPGGYIVITVWNLWQKKYIKKIHQNWFDKLKGKSELDWNDCYISFTDNEGKKFQRFHHAFSKRELKKLFKQAGFKIEECKIIEGRNILLIGKK